MSRTQANLEDIDALVDQQRERLEQIFTKKHDELIVGTEVFRETLEHCAANGFKHHAAIWNVGIYINMAAHDLSVLVQQLHFERNVWTRRLIARHTALAIYEVTEDMTHLLGKKLRDSLEMLGLLSKYDAKLRAARRPLDNFWKEHYRKLREIRRMSAAHRDLDGLSLLNSITSIDIVGMSQLGMELHKILCGIGSVMNGMLNDSSLTQPPEMKNQEG